MLNSLVEKFGKEYQKDDIIFCDNEPASNFFLLQKGNVKIVKIINHTEKTMDILTPGNIFGEMAILEEQPRSATAIALDNISLLCFDRSNFTTLLKSQPQIAYKLLEVFSKRIYDARRRLMILLLEDVDIKVADVFLMLAEKDPSYSANENLKHIILPVTIHDVANWCAESIDDVSEALTHWEKLNKIEINPTNIVILNIIDFKRIVNTKRRTQER